jgi:hypothetical protein
MKSAAVRECGIFQTGKKKEMAGDELRTKRLFHLY